MGAVASALLLARHRFLPGTDAYAYVLQARILWEQHRLQIHDGAWLVHGLDAVAGSVLGFDNAVALLMGVAAFLPLAALAPRPRGPCDVSRVVAAIYALASPSLWFTAVEFPRQALACGLLPLWVHAWRRRGPWLAVPLVSAACHRAFLVLALGFLAAALVEHRVLRALVAVVAGAACVWFVRERDDVTPRLLLALPYVGLALLARRSSAPSANSRGQRSMNTVERDPVRRAPTQTGGLAGGRRVAVSVSALALATLASLALRPLVHPDTHGAGRDLDAEARAVAALDTDPALATDPALRSSASTLIARRRLAFLFTATTARDALLFEPGADVDDAGRARFFRAVHGVAVAELVVHLPERCPYGSALAHAVADTGYALVREDCYEEMRAGVDARESPGLAAVLANPAENPAQKRPGFLGP